MAVKRIFEFNNSGSSASKTSSSSSNKETPTSLATKAKFEVGDATDEAGLVIAPNGMVAVEYDIASGDIIIRPDNDLAIGSQELSKFKADLTAAEKLAGAIAKLK